MVATIVVALVLPPLIISHVGFKSFTVWMFALSFIDYFWLSDIGLRSATVHFSARFWASRDYSKLGDVVSSASAFSALVALIVFAVVYAGAPALARFFTLTDPVFVTLLRMVSASWGAMLVFTVFSSCLEGCQRFDLTGRVWVASLAARVIGILAVVDSTSNLVYMGAMLVLAQLFWCTMIFILFRRELPQVKWNPFRVNFSLLGEMWSYGVHTFVGGVSNFVLSKSIQPMIARFLGPDAFGIYFLPRRLMDYAMDGVGRIGMVTAPNAAELIETGRKDQLRSLGVFTNRYSLALFAPAAAFLLVFAEDLLLLWLSSAPDSARQAAALVPALLLGQTVWAGQFNSASILTGIGKHKVYSRFVLTEGVLVILANLILLPTRGLASAVWVSSILMAINRGLITNWLVSRELEVSPWRYALDIYRAPLALAAMEFGLMSILRAMRQEPGWNAILVAAFVLILTYAPLAVRFVLTPAHRDWLLGSVRARFSPGKEVLEGLLRS